MAITRPQLHDAIVQTKEYIDKNISELQDKIYSRGGYVIVDSLPVQNVQMDKTYLVPKVDSNGYAISGSYLEYVYAVRYNSGTTITDGLIDLLYDKFIKMLPNSGTYAFVYDNDIWKYNDETVVLYDYGITILDGTPVQDDTITISVSNGSWEPLGDATLDLSGYYNKTELYTKTEIDNKETAIKNSKQDIMQYSVIPEPSATYLGKIIHYTGDIYTDCTDTVADFYGSGTSNNYSIAKNSLKMFSMIPGTGYIHCRIPFTNHDIIKVVRKQSAGGSNIAYIGFTLGTTVGGSDIYTSPSWGSIGVGNETTDTIDLTVYEQETIYLSFKITVDSYNNVEYTVTHIYYDAPEPEFVHGYFYECINTGANNNNIYKWQQTNIQPNGTTINSLDDINDVEITDAQDGQAIVYDEENDKWINKTVQGSSNIIDDTIATANKTWSSHKISEAIGAIQSTINNNNDSIETTLVAANWDSNGEQTITFDHLPDDINGVIGVPISATLTQKEEFSNCNITVIAQNTNELTFKANEIPTINLPVMIYTGSENIVDARYNYSTEEQVIGTWIDGSPIYQKTVDCGALPNTAYKTVAHGVSNIGIPMRIWGVAWNNSTSVLLPFMDDESIARIGISFNATEIFIGSRQYNASSYTNSLITIQYTKTVQQQEPVEEPEEQSGE